MRGCSSSQNTAGSPLPLLLARWHSSPGKPSARSEDPVRPAQLPRVTANLGAQQLARALCRSGSPRSWTPVGVSIFVGGSLFLGEIHIT